MVDLKSILLISEEAAFIGYITHLPNASCEIVQSARFDWILFYGDRENPDDFYFSPSLFCIQLRCGSIVVELGMQFESLMAIIR